MNPPPQDVFRRINAAFAAACEKEGLTPADDGTLCCALTIFVTILLMTQADAAEVDEVLGQAGLMRVPKH